MSTVIVKRIRVSERYPLTEYIGREFFLGEYDEHEQKQNS